MPTRPKRKTPIKKKKASSVVYKSPDVRIRDKRQGSKTTSYVTYGGKAGPKGAKRKLKIVDKKTPGGRSTVAYGSNTTLKELASQDILTGKELRDALKNEKKYAKSVTMNGRKYKTKNKAANPNLRKGAVGRRGY
tara:strand:- start:458 stop:862 length:405 start_codon:yes stop_codon:yes gene_type:complete